MTPGGRRRTTGACGVCNAAGIRPPSSSGVSSSGWRPPRHGPLGAAAAAIAANCGGRRPALAGRRPLTLASPRPAGYRGPAVTPVPGRDRRALCQQHCGFLMQSTWCVGHAGTEEAACAAVPVSIKAGPAAKAVASAAEASTYVRAARGRPCFRLIISLSVVASVQLPGWGPLVPQGGLFQAQPGRGR